MKNYRNLKENERFNSLINDDHSVEDSTEYFHENLCIYKDGDVFADGEYVCTLSIDLDEEVRKYARWGFKNDPRGHASFIDAVYNNQFGDLMVSAYYQMGCKADLTCFEEFTFLEYLRNEGFDIPQLRR